MQQQVNNLRARVTGDYQTFEEFYPFYLSQHSNKTNRILHYIGTTLAMVQLICAIISGSFWSFLLVPILGYSFAWVGHFFFEQNKPATFKYPLWSLMGDFRMIKDAAFGKSYKTNIGGV